MIKEAKNWDSNMISFDLFAWKKIFVEVVLERSFKMSWKWKFFIPNTPYLRIKKISGGSIWQKGKWFRSSISCCQEFTTRRRWGRQTRSDAKDDEAQEEKNSSEGTPFLKTWGVCSHRSLILLGSHIILAFEKLLIFSNTGKYCGFESESSHFVQKNC